MAAKKTTLPSSDFSNPRCAVTFRPTKHARTYFMEARNVTKEILETYDLDAIHPIDLFGQICDSIDVRAKDYNEGKKTGQWPLISVKGLPADSLARFVAETYHMCHVQTTDNTRNLPISVYMTRDICRDETRLGTYCDDPNVVKRCIHEWEPNMSDREMATIISILHEIVPNVYPCSDENLVPCNNVIVNTKEGVYFPYSHEYIFTSKILTDYDPNAEEPTITQADGTVWRGRDLIPSFTSKPEIAALLWQIVAASLRRNKVWEVSPWFYSTQGNNGKGTLCALIRNIIGSQSVANLSLPQLSNDFYAAQAVGKVAIIADENPVGMYIDDSSNYKDMVTGDPININQKYERVFSYKFTGMIIQCINDFPRVKDHTGSFIRRILPIEFDQCFTGRANPAIKNDYLRRPEVLRWFLKRALDLQFDTIAIPDCCRDLIEEYREANDIVREFANEVKNRFSWDLIPHTLAYPMYKNWMEKNNPSVPPLGRNRFISRWVQAMTEDHEWICPAGNYYSSNGRMVGPEHTILEYDVEGWANTSVSKYRNPDQWCTPTNIKPQYRGILRRVPKRPIDPSRPDYEKRMAEHQDKSFAPCSADDLDGVMEWSTETMVARS